MVNTYAILRTTAASLRSDAAMAKYDPLTAFLQRQPGDKNAIRLSFHRLEQIIGRPLPTSLLGSSNVEKAVRSSVEGLPVVSVRRPGGSTRLVLLGLFLQAVSHGFEPFDDGDAGGPVLAGEWCRAW